MRFVDNKRVSEHRFHRNFRPKANILGSNPKNDVANNFALFKYCNSYFIKHSLNKISTEMHENFYHSDIYAVGTGKVCCVP